MQRSVFISLLILLACTLLELDFYASLGFSAAGFFAAELFFNMSTVFAFREFFVLLYAVNYLFSPAVSYSLGQELFFYRMKIGAEQYFLIILPAFICLYIGLRFFKTNIFQTDFSMVRLKALINEQVLKQWLLAGVLFYFLRPFFPGELAFFLYLASMIRYVAAFSLFNLNPYKYRRYLFLVIGLEAYGSIAAAMFHDTVMWLIFFVLFISYTGRYSLRLKVGYSLLLALLFLFIQSIKSEYRSRTWGGAEQAGLTTFASSSSTVLGGPEESSIFSEGNLVSSITRVNQAWIFSSVVDRMDRVKDFQDLRLIGLYLEAAFLPRFLAPNKITSGNKEIFNQYSGHTINQGTSMGLGIFSDGYIAFGAWGVWIFAFFFGLLFSIVFKIVESWSSISPFFILFIFPILNYAVRPDCELQTILGHLVKSTLVFGLLVAYYRRYFEREIEISQRLQVQ
jgi:hypothetical protein